MVTSLLSVEVVGLDKVLAGLLAFQDAAKDLRPFWRDVFAPAFFADVQDRFATGGRQRNALGQFRAGTAWAPLSPRYRVWKARHFPGQPILVRTGELRGSLAWSGSGPGPGGIFDPQPDHVSVGTSVKHGVYHMRGTARMPARRFMGAPDPKKFAPLLREWLLRTRRSKAP